MGKRLAEEIEEKMKASAQLYHHLVLVVALPGEGKTAALLEVSRRTGTPLLNVNLELSQRLLGLTHRQRALQVERLLQDIAQGQPGDAVLLDNTEILFDDSLKQDPLRLLQSISRHKEVAATWSGSFDGIFLAYAVPGHPEYRKYPVNDLLVARPGAPT